MFYKFILKTFKNLTTRFLTKSGHTDWLAQASKLYEEGRSREALEAYRKHLEIEPHDAAALVGVGACLADIGNLQEASEAFELAYSLDDNYLPAVVNHAKLLCDRRKSADALPLLKEARVIDSSFRAVDNIYAGICMARGDAQGSRQFQLRAWLAHFDQLRISNGFLFNSAYCDMDEKILAAEHLFWAETLRPVELPAWQAHTRDSAEKIRIGYWSPDFRNHSVRYFFRPLLENHNRERFEIFLYHDIFSSDAQTEAIKARCDHFHHVDELTDTELCKLIHSHQLDILVELAGHTSKNRLNLLQQRFATLQITALGYPPTTGLSTIDAKLLDQHLLTDDSGAYYAEKPMVLPSSFWCFDPMEDAPLAAEPPLMRNGYVTFGCVGNIAKITAPVLDCWREIMRRIPHSRLLIRSISFEDAAAETAALEQYRRAGLPMDRIDLHKPAGGTAFFTSYNDIDIILDTTPFNGGTTTCFAVYMGVPVISWAGKSLISRMGLSILNNVDAGHLVASDAAGYIQRAVALSQDLPYLKTFKQEARQRMQMCGLGNGRIFAHEFEQACLDFLRQKQQTTPHEASRVPALPANEIVRRAYHVLQRGQSDAGQRILAHCLRHYPDSAGAHILATSTLTEQQKFAQAASYLLERLPRFAETEKIAALINIARCQLADGQPDAAEATVKEMDRFKPADDFENLQVQLYRACFNPQAIQIDASAKIPSLGKICCIIPCDSSARFNAMRAYIDSICTLPAGWNIEYRRCDESQRIKAYQALQESSDIDVLVIIQKNVDIHHPYFFFEIISALQDSSIVGFAGASQWRRLDWSVEEFEYKAAGFLTTSKEKPGMVEIQLLGNGHEKIKNNMAVLDGNLIALTHSALVQTPFDENLLGAEALLEQAWTYDAFQAGEKIAVHRHLGVFLRSDISLENKNNTFGRMHLVEQMNFDVLALFNEDHAFVNLITSDIPSALEISESYFHIK